MKSVLLRGFRHAFEGAGWLKFGQLGSLDWVEMFPVGPPCRARLDLVDLWDSKFRELTEHNIMCV